MPIRCALSHGLRLSPILVFVLAACAWWVAAPVEAREDAKAQRVLFVKVESALKVGNRGLLKRHRAELQNYPLYPYLVRQDLHRRLANVKEDELIGFLNTYGGSVPVAEKLRHRWLKQLARRGRWNSFVDHYQESATVENKDNRCRYASALIHAQRRPQAEEWVKSLWLVDFSQPPQCDFAFKWGFEQGVLTDDLVWDRLLLVWAKGKARLTDYLGGRLSPDVRRWFVLLKQARYHPERTALKVRQHLAAAPYARDIMLFSLRRLLAKDVNKAGKVWEKIRRNCGVCDQLRVIEKEIGIKAAKRLMPTAAYHWLSQLPVELRDNEVRYWRIRAALREQKWERVIVSIDELTPQQRAFPQWQYWRAYALAALGQRKQARDSWRQLAKHDHYYGYLAADHVNAHYAHNFESLEFSDAEMASLDAYPAVARMRELIALKRPFDASRELLLLLDDLDAQTKLKLAAAATRWRWPIGAIRSIASSATTRHLRERFPMPYRSLIEDESRRSNVPMEWIYGIMRRESAFVERIRSPAGALGLMQLRPGTAQAVSSQLGMGKMTHRSILSPQTNVRLGTDYIKKLFRRNNRNLVFGLAGYNAGPTNVRRWMSKAPVADLAVWVDTIPFDETRLYVRAVLFYMLAYRHRLNKPSIRMKDLIRGR